MKHIGFITKVYELLVLIVNNMFSIILCILAKARHKENITDVLSKEQLKKTFKTKIKSRNSESTKTPETIFFVSLYSVH